jgi:hypothetical protein
LSSTHGRRNRSPFIPSGTSIWKRRDAAVRRQSSRRRARRGARRGVANARLSRSCARRRMGGRHRARSGQVHVVRGLPR